MRLIDLSPEDVRWYGWHRLETGTYIDRDGHDEINVVAVRDGVSGEIIATVLYAGVGVVTVRSDITPGNPDGWGYDFPAYTESDAGQRSHAAFLVAIREAREDAVEFVEAKGMDALWESELVGDGHEVVDFIGRVAQAVHREFPDETPEPRGW